MKFYYYSETEIGIFSRLRNRSKLVERSCLVVIHLLLGAKSIILNIIWRVGG